MTSTYPRELTFCSVQFPFRAWNRTNFHESSLLNHSAGTSIIQDGRWIGRQYDDVNRFPFNTKWIDYPVKLPRHRWRKQRPPPGTSHASWLRCFSCGKREAYVIQICFQSMFSMLSTEAYLAEYVNEIQIHFVIKRWEFYIDMYICMCAYIHTNKNISVWSPSSSTGNWIFSSMVLNWVYVW